MPESCSEESEQIGKGPIPKRGEQVRPHPVEYSRSAYENARTPLPPSSKTEDRSLLFELVRNRSSSDEPSGTRLIIVEVNDFEIYGAPSGKAAYQFSSLHRFNSRASNLCFNGVVSSPLLKSEFYVENVLIEDISIEGYNDDEHPGTEVYLKSRIAAKHVDYDIWYQLKKPSMDYASLYRSFQWISQFGKHAIDFIDSRSGRAVHLSHFREEFLPWAAARFKGNEQFEAWAQKRKTNCYLGDFNAYGDFLYSQAYNLPNAKSIFCHPIWGEFLIGGKTAIKEQPQPLPYTVCTPLVYECFSHMYFGSHLKEMSPEASVNKEQEHRKKTLGFQQPNRFTGQNLRLPPVLPAGSRLFKVGDVVGIPPDEGGSWGNTTKEYLAYVQRIDTLASGVQRLFVLWLYRPEDTIMLDMRYPFQDEMFLSDHCNCQKRGFLSSVVIRKYSVNWMSAPESKDANANIFVTRKYVTTDCSFVSLNEEDFLCRCKQAATPPVSRCKAAPGETVYIQQTRNGRLEPVVVDHWDNDQNRVYVRQLVRLQEVTGIQGLARDYLNTRRPGIHAPNELVWTNRVVEVSPSSIQRKCHIRYFSIRKVLDHEVAMPYNRRGNGDYWFITSHLTVVDNQPYLESLNRAPTPMKEGPINLKSSQPLKGLSIFSGGGNLDRGLEEGGAVTFTQAVDISREAVHTQLANSKGKNLQIYFGSVDNYLKLVLEGKDVVPLARIGDIQFIAAGSPCPGFSTMQKDPYSEQSLRNASHITTFCSFVDLYRPLYGILENVVSMTNIRKGHEDEKVFSQLVACLVALGYQANYYIMDAWNYSSCQSRRRLFISIAAPGLELIQPPPHTHSHPDWFKGRSLGKLPTGQPFGCQEYYPTPFTCTTAEQAIGDLPNIGSGFQQICVEYPDHRLSGRMNQRDRELMKRIPVTPVAMGYKEALSLGLLSGSLIKANKKVPGKAFRRIPPTGPIPTIMTQISPQDNRTGDIIHWEQPRPTTVMEARRAQGIPDDEVILGAPRDQWRIIGNGVDRNVSFALGLALRQAVEKTHEVNGPRAALRLTAEYGKVKPDFLEQQGSSEVMGVHTTTKPLDLRTKTTMRKLSGVVITSKTTISWTSRKETIGANVNGSKTTQGHDEEEEDSNTISEPTSFSSSPNSISESSSVSGANTGGTLSHCADEHPSAQSTIVFHTERHRAALTAAASKRRSSEVVDGFGDGSNKKKRTRHSGLQAEFAPLRWDKKPETLLKGLASRSPS
ncbi:S-adenosyl-L-methionine-dependent methyltransferase [Westerdykella ornata]|uniref:DNA (cytosine-5-)-methyltransferase n=1 Tax=Westerdykella ornata TaxID=318751 RepID=A0A6A6J941_WESOR|nr:S-adenosyl-L-methionine-dependent methyltransferase [Westerdykella ornata]KAF2272156.1 S-adenosyl-L-methionine-dependent methyltransferase [Westerdykella ornata]